MTMRQVLDLALKQNPDIAIAHLDELKAEQAVRIAKDPFVPRVVVGSGLAYTTGFPMSIEGSAPTIMQARVIRTVYNRTQSLQLQRSKEEYRAAVIDASARRDDILFRTAGLYFDTERVSRELQVARQQVPILERVAGTVRARVAEGRELEIEAKRSNFNLARARQHVADLEAQEHYLESSLAQVLGFGPNDRVHTADEERPIADISDFTEDAAVQLALDNSKDLKRLQSTLLAKNLEVRAQKAARLPQLDLVAQYGLLAKYNYQDFFQKFQRNNGQLGVSIQFPVWTGNASAALARQAEIDAERIRQELAANRTRIALEARKTYQEYRNADAGRDLAKQDLEIAREQLSIHLAQHAEGRVPLAKVEETRTLENDKWVAFYDAEYALRKARLNVLRQTGSIMAAIE
jgi:outer membrane protein